MLRVFYLLDTVRRCFIKTRRLNLFEIEQAKSVFGNTIKWSAVRIREDSKLAKIGASYAGKKQLGFVLFNTINFTRRLDCEHSPKDMSWLIHELTHILQFRFIGVQYIIEALRAQHSSGYIYGGIDALKTVDHFENFNLEQQAEIVKHYYEYMMAKKEVGVFLPFIDELKRGKC